MRINTLHLRTLFLSLALCLIPVKSAVFFRYDHLPLYWIPLWMSLGLTVLWWIQKKKDGQRLFPSVKPSLKLLLFVVPLIAYFVFDWYSLAWTQTPEFLTNKYKLVRPLSLMLILLYCYFFEADTASRLRRGLIIPSAMGATAWGLSITCWILVAVYGRTHYIMRTALQSNYNRFSIAILLGALCGVYVLSQLRGRAKFLGLMAFLLPIYPIIYTSGTRRWMVLFIPLFFVINAPIIIETIRQWKKDKFAIALCVAALGISFWGAQQIITLYEANASVVYEEMHLAAPNEGRDAVSAAEDRSDGIIQPFRQERTLDAVEDTVESGEAQGQRDVIFAITKDVLDDFTQREWWFGLGGSAHVDIYRTEEARAAAEAHGMQPFAHPHNFVLIDLIDGGIVKLVLMVLVLLACLILIIPLAKRDLTTFVFMLFFAGLHLLDEFVTSNSGILVNPLTWVFFAMVVAWLPVKNQSTQKDGAN